MNELTLKAGGTLEYVRWVQDDETEEGAYLPFDVSCSAAAYAMEPVRFAGEICVRDIFSLLERNPLLVSEPMSADAFVGMLKKMDED
jgi:hypothetical protein